MCFGLPKHLDNRLKKGHVVLKPGFRGSIPSAVRTRSNSRREPSNYHTNHGSTPGKTRSHNSRMTAKGKLTPIHDASRVGVRIRRGQTRSEARIVLGDGSPGTSINPSLAAWGRRTSIGNRSVPRAHQGGGKSKNNKRLTGNFERAEPLYKTGLPKLPSGDRAEANNFCPCRPCCPKSPPVSYRGGFSQEQTRNLGTELTLQFDPMWGGGSKKQGDH